jgi:hypothetical protein
VAALRDAREATGRSVTSGRPNKNFNPGKWLGAIGYFSYLDLVGTLLKRNDMEEPNYKNSIKQALYYFGGELSNKDIHAIAGLRNAFMHSYGLVSYDSEHLTNKKYIYQVDQGSTLITHPRIEWDGNLDRDYSKITTFSYFTKISLKGLGELAEGIHIKIRHLIKDNKIEINSPFNAKIINDLFFIAYDK